MLLSIVIAMQLVAMDRCHGLYTDISREIAAQTLALNAIDTCLKFSTRCGRARFAAYAFSRSDLSQLIDDMTEFSSRNPSCYDRFGASINREVGVLLGTVQRVRNRLMK